MGTRVLQSGGLGILLARASGEEEPYKFIQGLLSKGRDQHSAPGKTDTFQLATLTFHKQLQSKQKRPLETTLPQAATTLQQAIHTHTPSNTALPHSNVSYLSPDVKERQTFPTLVAPFPAPSQSLAI